MGIRRIDEATLDNLFSDFTGFSNKGWFIDLYTKSDEPNHIICDLRNFNTSEKKTLPDLPHKYSYFKHIIILTAPNAPQPCYVFFLIANKPFLLFCRPGDRSWTSWKYDKNQQEESCLRDAVKCNDTVYVLHGPRSNLCEIEILGDGVFNLKRHGAMLPESSPLSTYRLVESCGELFAVWTKSIFDINVFKMDFSQNRWQQVFNLSPDRCFAFSDLFSTSFTPPELGGGIDDNTIFLKKPEFTIVDNTIFITEEKDDDQSLYSFNLADMSLSVSRIRSGTTPWTLHDQMTIRFPKKSKDRSNKHKERLFQGSKEYIINSHSGGSTWFQLPLDIQMLIFQYLTPVFDWMTFRAVCKKWRSLVYPIQWSPNQRSLPFESPWLMFPHGETKGIYGLYDPIGNLMHSICIPELENCKIRFSHQGCLLVTKDQTSIFFFEPFTKEKVQLPDLVEHECWFDAFCVSGTPTSTDWQILGINTAQLILYHLRPGQEQWSTYPINCTEILRPSFSNLVFDGENFCYLGRNGKVICFKQNNPQDNWFVLGSSSSSFPNDGRQFLACYEGELMSVWIDNQGRDSIDVFKLNSQGDGWVQINSLDDKNLYLSQTTTLTVEAMYPRVRNTVQLCMFSEIHGKDKNCGNISYSFKDQSFHVYNDRIQGYSPIGDLFDTKEIFLRGTWIQPLMQPHAIWNV